MKNYSNSYSKLNFVTVFLLCGMLIISFSSYGKSKCEIADNEFTFNQLLTEESDELSNVLTEIEWNEMIRLALQNGQIPEGVEIPDYEVLEMKWKGRRESTNVLDYRRWVGGDWWLHWALNHYCDASNCVGH